MRNKIVKYGIFSLYLVIMLSSCTSYKKVPYIQETKENYETLSQVFYQRQNVRFQTGDQVAITVNSSSEPASAVPFNLPIQPVVSGDNFNEVVNQGVGRQTYLVDESGMIDFPVLGKLKVAGKSRQELEIELKKLMLSYVKEEPVVTVRLVNFKISVTGEVNRPGVYSVSRERINLLEALALAGDMSIYGKRENVAVIREMPDGTLATARLDLTTTTIMESPYFYLHQNDVVYVEPNKTRAQSSGIGAQTGIWISLGSIALTLANLIILLTKK